MSWHEERMACGQSWAWKMVKGLSPHTHWDKAPCVTPQRRNHPHFAFALPNLNGFLWKQNGMPAKCGQMCQNANEEGEEREIERGKLDTLRRRGGYHGSVGIVPCLWNFTCHKYVGQTVTMPVASPNYSTIVLISKSCISKAHEILKHLGSWRCCKWRNGNKGRCVLYWSLQNPYNRSR